MSLNYIQASAADPHAQHPGIIPYDLAKMDSIAMVAESEA
jgi:hypothetical protein